MQKFAARSGRHRLEGKQVLRLPRKKFEQSLQVLLRRALALRG